MSSCRQLQQRSKSRQQLRCIGCSSGVSDEPIQALEHRNHPTQALRYRRWSTRVRWTPCSNLSLNSEKNPKVQQLQYTSWNITTFPVFPFSSAAVRPARRTRAPIVVSLTRAPIVVSPTTFLMPGPPPITGSSSAPSHEAAVAHA
jgi:hypothetical protein